MDKQSVGHTCPLIVAGSKARSLRDCKHLVILSIDYVAQRRLQWQTPASCEHSNKPLLQIHETLGISWTTKELSDSQGETRCTKLFHYELQLRQACSLILSMLYTY